jgi:hypothetical protein
VTGVTGAAGGTGVAGDAGAAATGRAVVKLDVVRGIAVASLLTAALGLGFGVVVAAFLSVSVALICTAGAVLTARTVSHEDVTSTA